MNPLALVELARLTIDLRARFSGRYWQWRMNTAEGPRRLDPAARRRAALDFANWRRRMRKMCDD
ncbi:MAG: hypothetical protein CMJ31_11410 [Phycisphaerae bacterium]|nr:hypothetical protein [Phycisphaerae bacterium]